MLVWNIFLFISKRFFFLFLWCLCENSYRTGRKYKNTDSSNFQLGFVIYSNLHTRTHNLSWVREKTSHYWTCFAFLVPSFKCKFLQRVVIITEVSAMRIVSFYSLFFHYFIYLFWCDIIAITRLQHKRTFSQRVLLQRRKCEVCCLSNAAESGKCDECVTLAVWWKNNEKI